MISGVMAETEGFEPSMQYYPHTPLAGERFQPLSHVSKHVLNLYAEQSKTQINIKSQLNQALNLYL